MVSIIIPAFNEEGAIADTVRRVRDTLQNKNVAPIEIIVVDDGSSDRTGDLAHSAGARVIRNPHNVGYGRSLKIGITHATNDTIVITDADGTYPIEEIPALLEHFNGGFDMVVGARRGTHYRGSAIKWPMRILLRFLVEWCAGRSIPDINSGLRVFSRKTAMPFFGQLCDTFSFTTSLTLAYMMTSKFVDYLPIDYHERMGTTKVRLWRDSLRTMQYIVQAILYYDPLKIFTLMTIFCFVIAGVSVGIGVTFKLLTGFMMGVGALIAGILVFGLGLLADLLRQIMAKS
ncbi:glycosyltransferase family 2 protein [Thalassospiraceae bacterium LMO-SO8]|nr:glycosyltransferase family 2 protein [Alphaproteobacteria bacterium LMO-S08]WND77704.1 glycosyltransferase family 2 protein [Thalassospiraceae bacterium LMO-SO8]